MFLKIVWHFFIFDILKEVDFDENLYDKIDIFDEFLLLILCVGEKRRTWIELSNNNSERRSELKIVIFYTNKWRQ